MCINNIRAIIKAGPAQTAIQHDSIARTEYVFGSYSGRILKFIFKSLYIFNHVFVCFFIHYKNINFTKRK